MGCLHTSSDFHQAFRIPTHGGRNCMSCGGHTEPSPCALPALCAPPQFQSVAGGEILRLASLAQDDREEVSFHTPSSLGHGVRIATPALRRWFAMTEIRSVRSAARISFVSVGAIHESPADADACLTNGLSRAPAPTARNDVSPFHAPRIPIRAAQRHTTILHPSLFTLHFPRPLCA